MGSLWSTISLWPMSSLAISAMSSPLSLKSQMSIFCSMRLLVDGLGDDGDAPLHVPPQSHLSGALAVFLTDLGQDGVGKDAVVALGKGPPGLGVDAVLLHQSQSIFLLEKGVELHLIHGGLDLHGLADVRQNLGIAVAHADGLQLAGLVRLFHGSVGADVVAHGLMDQIQIDIVQSQLLHRGLNGLLSALIAGVLHPQLGGDETVSSRGTPHLAMARPTASSFI